MYAWLAPMRRTAPSHQVTFHYMSLPTMTWTMHTEFNITHQHIHITKTARRLIIFLIESVGLSAGIAFSFVWIPSHIADDIHMHTTSTDITNNTIELSIINIKIFFHFEFLLLDHKIGDGRNDNKAQEIVLSFELNSIYVKFLLQSMWDNFVVNWEKIKFRAHCIV